MLGSNEPITLFATGLQWEVFEDGGHDTARAVVDLAAQGEPGGNRAQIRFARTARPHPATDRRATGTGREAVGRMVGRAPTSRDGREGRSAQRTDAPRALSRSDGLDPGRRNDLAAGGARRCRNWDYRYCWLRDAAMSARALVDLGLADRGRRVAAVGRRRASTAPVGIPRRLHPLYTVDGLELGPEAVIDTLPGYAGSRPVRSATPRIARSSSMSSVRSPTCWPPSSPDAARCCDRDWRCVEAMVTAVERRWQEPDHGVWEARLAAAPPCLLESDVLVDSGSCTASAGPSRTRRHRSWLELRDRIRDDVLEQGGTRAGSLLRRLRDRRSTHRHSGSVFRASCPTTTLDSSPPSQGRGGTA